MNIISIGDYSNRELNYEVLFLFEINRIWLGFKNR